MSITIFNCKVLFLSASSLSSILFFISENEALVTLTARAGQGDGQSAGGGQQRTVQSPEFGG